MQVDVIIKGEDPTGIDFAIGVIAINGVEIGPALPISQAHVVRAWLVRCVEFLSSFFKIRRDENVSDNKFYLDISGPDGESFRLQTPSPIVCVDDSAEMYILFGGDYENMPAHWKRMYDQYGPPDRRQRLLIASYAMDLWNIFNRRQIVATVPVKNDRAR